MDGNDPVLVDAARQSAIPYLRAAGGTKTMIGLRDVTRFSPWVVRQMARLGDERHGDRAENRTTAMRNHAMRNHAIRGGTCTAPSYLQSDRAIPSVPQLRKSSVVIWSPPPRFD